MEFITQGNFSGLFEQMCREGEISSTQQALFQIMCSRVKYRKGEILAAKESRVQKLYIVRSGVVRNYVHRFDGKDFTKSMAGEGMIIGPYEDYLAQVSNSTWFEALTNAEVDEFSIEAFVNLMRESKGGRRLIRLLGEMFLYQKEWREVSLLSKSALDRYREFRDRFAKDANSIAKNKIATYIGITPEGLSRIVK